VNGVRSSDASGFPDDEQIVGADHQLDRQKRIPTARIKRPSSSRRCRRESPERPASLGTARRLPATSAALLAQLDQMIALAMW